MVTKVLLGVRGNLQKNTKKTFWNWVLSNTKSSFDTDFPNDAIIIKKGTNAAWSSPEMYDSRQQVELIQKAQ